jgi:hypothetical protein
MTTFIHNPGNENQINEIYAVLSVDKDGNEGIFAQEIDKKMYPLVSSKKEILERVFKFSAESAKICGMKVRLVRFSNREVVKEVTP